MSMPIAFYDSGKCLKLRHFGTPTKVQQFFNKKSSRAFVKMKCLFLAVFSEYPHCYAVSLNNLRILRVSSEILYEVFKILKLLIKFKILRCI